MAKNVHQQPSRSGALNHYPWHGGGSGRTNTTIDWKTPVVVKSSGTNQSNQQNESTSQDNKDSANTSK